MADVTRVLVVNAGSSSLKLDVVEDDESAAHSEHIQDWQGETDPIASMVHAARPDVVGHRVVHGGPAATGPVRINQATLQQISDAGELAPLHQPRALDGIRAVSEAAPGLVAVACFDTTFHRDLPEPARTYALPQRWRRDLGVRKYGFHGLSHAYVSRRATELSSREVDATRTVSCHLGSGASVCAIDRGRSVDTSMGMTPMDGLVMGTRPGSVDPGVILWLLRTGRLNPDEVEHALEHDSGLLGLAGSADLDQLLEADSAEATLAVDVYLHRLAGHVAAMTAAMNGIDVLAFTGGVGEHAPSIRSGLAERLSFLGVEVDEHLNRDVAGDAAIAPADSGVDVVVVKAREDLEIARQVRRLLS